MSDDYTLELEVGTHLRRVHFSLVAASFVCLAVTFGYRDSRIATAQEEFGVLSQFATEVGLRDANLKRIKGQLQGFKIAVSPEAGFLVTSAGISREPDITVPELADASGHDLSECAEWSSIERFDFASIQRWVEDVSADDMIRCRWIGEDSLLYGLAPQPKVEDLRVASPEGVAVPTEGQALALSINASRNVSLDECSGWGGIDRADFSEITTVISDSAASETIRCRWIGEDQLLFANVSGEEAALPKKLWIATPTGRTLADRSKLNTLGLQLIDGRSLEQCGGSAGPESHQPMLGHLSERVHDGIPILCKWSVRGQLLVYPVDWNLPKNKVPEKLRDIMGRDYVRAFPSLSALEDEIQQALDSFSNDGPWDKKNLVFIESHLQTRLLALDKLDIFGFPLNRTLLFYGGTGFIVLLQTYFLLHFGQLKWIDCRGFPWVGLYDDLFSRTIFLLSVGLLPPVVLWIFVYEELAPVAWVVRTAAGCSTLIAMMQARATFQRWASNRTSLD